MSTEFDQQKMRRALELARLGLYSTDPNPRVGCVLVRDGEVVGEGWHLKAGEAHAEVHALAEAGERARGATAYVTLEPCSHFGRTPPCADALVRAGVKRVVAALPDPNPLVDGGGLRKLKTAGIEVETGLLEAEARELNVGYVKRMQTGLPWVRVKLAASLDGRTALANGESRWITNDASRADVQRWRARSSVVLTGVDTVIKDDPQLNARAPEVELLGRQPARAICDTRLRTPADARIFSVPGEVLLFASRAASNAAGKRPNASIVAVDEDEHGRLDLRAVMKELGSRACNEVWVEAGPTLSGRLLELGLADELIVYFAPVLLGQDAQAMLKLPRIEAMKDRLDLRLMEVAQIGQDLRVRFRPSSP